MPKLPVIITIGAVALISLFALHYIEIPNSLLTSKSSTVSELPETEKQKWHQFTVSPSFEVQFPTLPQHATEKIEDPKTKEPRQYEMFVSEKDNGTIFMISIIKLLDVSKAKIDQSALSNVMSDMLNSTPNSKLKDMKMGSYKQYPSIDFSIENDQINIDGKVFLVNNTMYVLTSAAKMGVYKPQESKYFFDSFELKQPEPAPPTAAPAAEPTPQPTGEK